MTDLSAYCRELESYLCRKNGGHLVRIVGPAFEQVCGWANRGVPLTVAYRGIDRYCERLAAREGDAKGGRRRPVRVEFCEGDILDLFDDWRRAVGIVQAQGETEPAGPARKPALTAHLERVVARLVGSWGPLSWQGRWAWHWKDRIDRKFVERYRKDPAAGPG